MPVDRSESEPDSLPSLGRSSAARLGSDLSKVVLGLATATITARVLGPAEKGTLTTVLYLATLLSYAGSLGLGDALIVWSGRRYVHPRDLFRTFLPIVTVWSISISPALLLAAWIAGWSGIHGALLLAIVMVPLLSVGALAAALHHAREDFVWTSTASVIATVASLLACWILLVVFDTGLQGAVAAAVVGAVVNAAILLLSMKRVDAEAASTKQVGLLMPALRFGVPHQVTYLSIALSERVDILLVYGLLGEAQAGVYSIALAVGSLAAYAPSAMIMATFPRLASLPEAAWAELLSRLTRVVILLWGGVAVVVGMLSFVGIRLLFGEAFSSAQWPTLVILLGGLFSSLQWLLSKAAAARRQTRIGVATHGITLICLLLGSLVLQVWGSVGIAAASSIAHLVGLCACLVLFRLKGLQFEWRQGFLPRRGDVRFVVETFHRVLPRG